MSTFGIYGAAFTALLAASSASCSSGASAVVASALGESCTRTADCQTGLVCVENTCVGADHKLQAGGVDSGGVDSSGTDSGAMGAGSSRIGESCQTTRDCAPGLDCVPSSGGASVCDLVSYGVTAGGKTCSGECSEAAHCCSLPSGTSLSVVDDAGAFVIAENCEDILLVGLGGSTSACAQPASLSAAVANACFYYQTYCSCAADTWACSAGKCVYTASCQTTVGDSLGGCPLFSRTRSTLNTTCDAASHKCLSASSLCSTDAECDGSRVTDSTNVVCRGGDCTCYAGSCYLQCAKDLDCPSGDSCDTTTTKLCVPASCSNDAECFSQLGKARAKCNKGTCGIPCTVDRDCSPSGDIAGQPFNGTACGPDGVCAPVGCASDADCASSGGQRLFCVTPTVTNVRSAITN